MSDGTVVVRYRGGQTACSSTGFDAVAPDGSLNYGWGAAIPTALEGLPPGAATATADGKLVVAFGAPLSFVTPTAGLELARFTADGALDQSFGTDGVITLPSGVALSSLTTFTDGSVAFVRDDLASMSFSGGTSGISRVLEDGTLVAATGGYDADGVLRVPGITKLVGSGAHLVALSGGSDNVARAYDLNGNPVADWPVTGANGVSPLPSSGPPNPYGMYSTAAGVIGEKLTLASSSSSLVTVHRFKGLLT